MRGIITIVGFVTKQNLVGILTIDYNNNHLKIINGKISKIPTFRQVNVDKILIKRHIDFHPL